MSAYTILSSSDVQNPVHKMKVGQKNLLSDVQNPLEAQSVLTQAGIDLLADYDALVLYLYIEPEAVQWRGFVARAIVRKGGALRVFFDNNPIERRALWFDENEE